LREKSAVESRFATRIKTRFGWQILEIPAIQAARRRMAGSGQLRRSPTGGSWSKPMVVPLLQKPVKFEK
jgi:hypothetical protein